MRVARAAAFEALGLDRAAWDALVRRSGAAAPFSGWAFQTAWWRAFADGPLQILGVLGASDEWVGLLPLYEAPTPGGPNLRLVGGIDVADYLDVIAVRGREREVWQALLPVLAAGATGPVDLRPVPAASPTASLLSGLAPAAGLACAVAVEDRCPVIALPSTWEDYLATLSGKDRHELRRKLRRAEAGAPRVEVGRTPEAVAAGLDHFLALHRLSKVGKARFMDTRMEAFFREIGPALAAAGQAALWTLWLAGRPAAALFCLEYGDTVGLYNSGFDPEARAMSPGVVLIARTIEDAITRGFRRYDFLRGDEPYKYGFGAVPADVLRVTLARPATGG